jgi:type I restriction enzyme, S subunit
LAISALNIAYSDSRTSVPEQTAIGTILCDMHAEIATLGQRFAKAKVMKQGVIQELLIGKTRLP